MPLKNKCDFLLKTFLKDKENRGAASEIYQSYLTECQRLCSSAEKDDFKCKNFMSIMEYIIKTN